MAKQSGYLQRMQAHTSALLAEQRSFCIQTCADILAIAAHEEFGFGEDRTARLLIAFYNKLNEYADLVNTDYKDDKTLEYTKDVIDRLLIEAVGKDNFQPWDVRHSSQTVTITRKCKDG